VLAEFIWSAISRSCWTSWGREWAASMMSGLWSASESRPAFSAEAATYDIDVTITSTSTTDNATITASANEDTYGSGAFASDHMK
jgi:hypothetical protein